MTLPLNPEFLEALEIAQGAGTPVDADVMSGGGFIYHRKGLVSELSIKEQHCHINGGLVAIRLLVRLQLQDGRPIESQAAIEKHVDLMKARDGQLAEVKRVLSEPGFVPASASGRIQWRGEVDGSISGQPQKLQVFAEPRKTSFALLRARSQSSASQAMQVLYSDAGYWNAVGFMLVAGLVWIPWYQMRLHCAELAAEHRDGLQPLEAKPSYEQAAARAALYAEKGLEEAAYGNWVHTGFMETFGDCDWFEALPGPRVRIATPPNMTWAQFQDSRLGYRCMTEAMREWLRCGEVAPEADKFYRVVNSPAT